MCASSSSTRIRSCAGRWPRSAPDGGDLALVGEAASADEATALCYAVRPDVVLIDDSLPNDDAWRLAAHLRASYPDLGIVILSASNTDQSLFRALDTGASAFVSKSAPVADVVAALRGAALAPASFSAAGLATALRRRRETSDRMALSPREQQILFLLHDGLSVPEIAGQLFVSLSTAKTYVTRLYDKLGARNRAQALMTAVRLGLFEGRLAAAPRSAPSPADPSARSSSASSASSVCRGRSCPRHTEQLRGESVPWAHSARSSARTQLAAAKNFIRWMTAGPSTTTKIAGSRQVMSGSSSLTCNFWALSSAR